MDTVSTKNTKVIMALVLVIALIMGIFVATQYRRHAQKQTIPINATLLQQPRTPIAFSMKLTNNKTLTPEALKGQWTLMFFGFTRCHAICPTTMAELARMKIHLQKEHFSVLPQVVMVTIDPDADVDHVLKQYVESFHRDFIGALPSKEQLHALTKQLGIAIMASPENHFDHSGTVVIFNPAGKIAGYFSLPHDGQIMANDFMKIIKRQHT